MAGTFVARIQVLRDNVGAGKLVGKVEVDQVMAADQHFNEHHHPDGGKSFYLRDPLYARASRYMTHLAEHTLSDEGRGLSGSMMDNMEDLSNGVYEEAPWEFGDLRASGHPSVRHNGELLHDRRPHRERLTRAELNEKGRLSRILDPERYK